jgi:hypothetical protein
MLAILFFILVVLLIALLIDLFITQHQIDVLEYFMKMYDYSYKNYKFIYDTLHPLAVKYLNESEEYKDNISDYNICLEKLSLADECLTKIQRLQKEYVIHRDDAERLEKKYYKKFWSSKYKEVITEFRFI